MTKERKLQIKKALGVVCTLCLAAIFTCAYIAIYSEKISGLGFRHFTAIALTFIIAGFFYIALDE